MKGGELRGFYFNPVYFSTYGSYNTAVPKRISLEEALVNQKLLTEEQLTKAQEESKKSGEPLRRVLVKLGMVAEEEIMTFLGDQLGIPLVDLSTYLIDSKVIQLVPQALAEKYLIIPLFKTGDTLTIAMADPLNVVALDEVRVKTGGPVETVLATESSIRHVIKQHYTVQAGSLEEIVTSMDEEALKAVAGEGDVEVSKLQSIVEDAPVIKLVNTLLMQAVRDSASDIHVEPEEDNLRIRFRIDGILHDVSRLPRHVTPAVTSRLKIMADLNIAKKRIPQDGRFQMKVGSSQIDMRVSTLPTIYGENVVMRILDTTGSLVGLDQLGFAPEIFKAFDIIIRQPYGIILVTGPTGSGKTTTLYSALNVINVAEKNIMTLEDPVEYRLRGIRQVQVNPKAGLTFADGLRSFLRQDPNVMMVGEIRDVETAEIAIQAALTGHLVFSTLHTNDAPSAATRLIDMGVEPFLISSSVLGIIAQRLVRLICPQCKESYVPGEKLVKDVGLPPGNYTFFRGKGCSNCKNSGYKGRQGLYELLTMNDRIKELITEKASANLILAAAQEAGMKTLREDGLQKVLNGVTTIDEVLRVTQIA